MAAKETHITALQHNPEVCSEVCLGPYWGPYSIIQADTCTLREKRPQICPQTPPPDFWSRRHMSLPLMEIPKLGLAEASRSSLFRAEILYRLLSPRSRKASNTRSPCGAEESRRHTTGLYEFASRVALLVNASPQRKDYTRTAFAHAPRRLPIRRPLICLKPK